MKKQESIIGNKFYRLLVLEETAPYISPKGTRHRKFNCKCDCGKEKVVTLNCLKKGNTKSCGCLRIEKSGLNGRKNKTHGQSTESFYMVWNDLTKRCRNKKNSKFSYYGGRGIKFNSRWYKFENFRDDMQESYKKHLKEHGAENTTIDRKDNEGDYSKENCRWATRKQQQNNKRTNLHIEYGGETKTLGEWCDYLHLNYSTTWGRINRGWSADEAFS